MAEKALPEKGSAFFVPKFFLKITHPVQNAK
jgi:hypothetical protein